MVYIDDAGKKAQTGREGGGNVVEAVVKRGESSLGEMVRGYVREVPYLKSAAETRQRRVMYVQGSML